MKGSKKLCSSARQFSTIMKGLLLVLLIISVDCNAQSMKDTPSFQTFWTQFRKAVIENDTMKIISFTKFPIKTRGPQDSDPYIYYAQNRFVSIFNDFLNRPTGSINDMNERQIDLIIKSEKVGPEIIENPRIGDMEFAILGGTWKLVFFYYWAIQ